VINHIPAHGTELSYHLLILGAGNISATEDFARSFPESRYALTQLALRSHDVDKVEEAVTAFSRIRRRDRYSSQVRRWRAEGREGQQSGMNAGR